MLLLRCSAIVPAGRCLCTLFDTIYPFKDGHQDAPKCFILEDKSKSVPFWPLNADTMKWKRTCCRRCYLSPKPPPCLNQHKEADILDVYFY